MYIFFQKTFHLTRACLHLSHILQRFSVAFDSFWLKCLRKFRKRFKATISNHVLFIFLILYVRVKFCRGLNIWKSLFTLIHFVCKWPHSRITNFMKINLYIRAIFSNNKVRWMTQIKQCLFRKNIIISILTFYSYINENLSVEKKIYMRIQKYTVVT